MKLPFMTQTPTLRGVNDQRRDSLLDQMSKSRFDKRSSSGFDQVKVIIRNQIQDCHSSGAVSSPLMTHRFW